MNILNSTKKILKRCLKNKFKINKKSIIYFLITGSLISNGEIKSNDVKLEKKDKVTIININKGENGLSYNRFNEFNLNSDESVIFNNSIKANGDNSVILKDTIKENENLNNSNDVNIIISEIDKDNKKTTINGNIEIYGNKSDLILVDEDGIIINDSKIYNGNNIYFSTLKLEKDEYKNLKYENLNKIFENDKLKNSDKEIKLGNISLNNVDSLNILASKININGKIDALNTNLNFLSEKYLETTEDSSIYGKNILIKINDNKNFINKGYIESKDDIIIDSETGEVKISKDDNIKLYSKILKKGDTNLYKLKDNDNTYVIDIATANEDGISYNKYDEFSVMENENLLFNNNDKLEKIYSTVLNKELSIINKNLNNKIANLIINEVKNKIEETNDSKRTKLEGNIEIIGENADLLIINKNGILVNGAKFYNTNNIGLGTGDYLRSFTNEHVFENNKSDIIFKNNINYDNFNFYIYSKDLKFENNVKFKNLAADIDGNLNNKNINVLENLKIYALNGKINNNSEIYGKRVILNAKSILNDIEAKVNSKELTYFSSIEELLNKGYIYSNSNITLRASSKLINEGIIKQDNEKYNSIDNVDIFANEFINKKEISSVGLTNINSKKLINELNSKIDSNSNIRLNSDNIENKGLINAKDDINVKGINFENIGNNLNEMGGVLSSFNNISIDLSGNFKNNNKGKIITKNILVNSNNILNDNSSIVSFGNFELIANEKIENLNNASILSLGNRKSKLISKMIINQSSDIKSKDNLEIITKELKNIGISKFINGNLKKLNYTRKLKVKESAWKSWFNSYSIYLSMPDYKNKIENQSANIISGANIYIHDNYINGITKKNIHGNKEGGRVRLLNSDSKIIAKNNIAIDGHINNFTTVHKIKINDLLKEIKIDLNWDTSSLLNSNTIFTIGRDTDNNSTLYDVIKNNKINLYGGKYLTLLKNTNIEKLNKILELSLGKDWKVKDKIILENENSYFKYYNKRNKAIISAGNDLYLEFGDIENSDTESYLNGIYEDTVIKDNEYEIIKESLVKNNGIFVLNDDDKYLNNINKSLYKHNDKYKGFDYLNENLNYESKAKSKLRIIGDDYYQNNLIQNILLKINDEETDISKEYIETLIENSILEGNRLSLKLGEKLTKEDINKLQKDIIWYIETSIDNYKVLSPMVYLSEKTLENIKKDKKNLSSFKAKNNILTYRIEDFLNQNSSLKSGNNINLKAENFESNSLGGLESNIEANKNINIISKNIYLNETSLLSNNDINLNVDKININSSDIISGNNVNIRAKEEINIEDKIIKNSESMNKQVISGNYQSYEEINSLNEDSNASNIKGKNVSINSYNDVNIKASNVIAEENLMINSKNLKIENSISDNKLKINKNSFGGNDFGSNIDYDSSYQLSNKSLIKGKNLVSINAKENINVISSDIVSENNIFINSGKEINIKDDNIYKNQTLNSNLSTISSIKLVNEKVFESRSNSSNILSKGNLEIEAKEDLNIKGSNIISNGLNIFAKNIKIETGVDNIKEEKYVSAFGINNSIDQIFDLNKKDKNLQRQLSVISSIANTDLGIGYELTNRISNNLVNKNSNIITGNLGVDIISDGIVDIGGLNLYTKGNNFISAKEIKSSKKLNENKIFERKIKLDLKQNLSVTSSLLDVMNNVTSIVEDNSNETVVALKAIGSATNLIFNDTIGVNSKQLLGFGYSFNKQEIIEDNKTNINSKKNILIKSTKDNIYLKNVDIFAKGKIYLDSEKNINISGGLKKETLNTFIIDVKSGLTQSLGQNLLFGSNAQVGIIGNTEIEISNNKYKENILSKLNSNKFELLSKGDTNLRNTLIKTDDTSKIKTKNLYLKSDLNEVDNNKFKIGSGFNISLGGASNTIFAARLGINSKVGYIYEKGNEILNQTAIESSNLLDIEVENDLILDTATIASIEKKGKLNVGNKILINDLKTDLRSDGAIVGGSVGLTGEFGLDIEIDDKKIKKQRNNSIIAFEKENINSSKVEINNKEMDVLDIENDISKLKIIEKEVYKKGGEANLSLSIRDTKSITNKIKNKILKPKDIKIEDTTNVYYKKFFDRKNLDTENKKANKKLELISKNLDNLPKEHVLEAVEKLTYGLSKEDMNKLRNKSENEGTQLVEIDKIENPSKKDIKNISKILSKLNFDDNYVKLRNEIDDTIVERLNKNERFHELMKSKLSGNEEGIKELFKIIEKVKREALKEKTGIETEKAKLVLNTERGPLSLLQGNYSNNTVNINAVPILSFLKTRKANNKEILDTIIHELTHHDQNQISKNEEKLKDIKNDVRLFKLNASNYIAANVSHKLYENQPLEKEAFIIGNNLAEKLSKLVDKKYIKNINEIIKIDTDNSKNLESPVIENAKLKENSLIYGLKDGKEELVLIADKNDKEKSKAITPDSYLENLGYEYYKLDDFAFKFINKELNENDINEIIENVDKKDQNIKERINVVDKEENKKILKLLLENEDATYILIKIANFNEMKKEVIEELKKNDKLDLNNIKKSEQFSEEENEVIEKYEVLNKLINDSKNKFLSEKNKIIANEILTQGGKIYFALDGIITDDIKYDKNRTKIDLEILKRVFDDEDPYYNKPISNELRYLYKNFKYNPNLKFTIKKQVIENPFINLELYDE